ncbi:hypothetical protein THRCLA_02803 [Thraustotheca clavata]|uniref:RRM domain-containing protein n=1 Tax=Thraustotheca clavata TaxID=74557 RepID=A0A1W0A446_9STRA|nr:hypothetical protein THRCLA_02803 [Thraustotheca clavata]
MNAKERRKLKRAQELAGKAESDVKVEQKNVEPAVEASRDVAETVAVSEAVANKEESADFIALPPTSSAKSAKKKLDVKKEQKNVDVVDASHEVSEAVGSKAESADFIALPPATSSANSAKERRLENRAAERAASTGNKVLASTENNATTAGESPVMNAKARRLAQRAAQREPKDENSSETKSAEPAKKEKTKTRPAKRKLADNQNEKRIHLTLFLGQLPFTATEEKIRKHFNEAGEIKIRMATDKQSKKFKGTAFIEVKDSKALGAALSRHHSLMDGRRINVELTANGGGKKSELRTKRIKELREKQSAKQIEKVRALLQKNVDDPECKLTQDDVDERMTDFLSWFDYETAKVALEEFNRCVNETVNNRRAFFMGILKRFRTTDGAEDRPAKKPRTSKPDQRQQKGGRSFNKKPRRA